MSQQALRPCQGSAKNVNVHLKSSIHRRATLTAGGGVNDAASAFRNDLSELGKKGVACTPARLTGKTSVREHWHQMPLQELNLEGTAPCQRQLPCCFSGRPHADVGRTACLVHSSRHRRRMRKAAKHANRQLRAMCSAQASALTEGAQAAMQLPAMR